MDYLIDAMRYKSMPYKALTNLSPCKKLGNSCRLNAYNLLSWDELTKLLT